MCSLKEGIFIGHSNTHVVEACLICQLSSISLCLQCKAVRRVLLGVRWGGGATSRGARMEFLIRGAPHSAPPAKAGKTKRPRPTLMGAWAGGAAGTHRAPFNQRKYKISAESSATKNRPRRLEVILLEPNSVFDFSIFIRGCSHITSAGRGGGWGEFGKC